MCSNEVSRGYGSRYVALVYYPKKFVPTYRTLVTCKHMYTLTLQPVRICNRSAALATQIQFARTPNTLTQQRETYGELELLRSVCTLS